MHLRFARRLTRAPYRRTRRRYPHDPMTTLYVDEAVTRTMVEHVTDEVRELRDRLTNFFFIVLGGLVVDVLTRIWRR